MRGGPCRPHACLMEDKRERSSVARTDTPPARRTVENPPKEGFGIPKVTCPAIPGHDSAEQGLLTDWTPDPQGLSHADSGCPVSRVRVMPAIPSRRADTQTIPSDFSSPAHLSLLHVRTTLWIFVM